MMLSRRGFLAGAWAPPKGREARIDCHCLALNGIVCRSCSEACPLDLIRFRPAAGGMAIPVIAVDRCNGCTDCLSACPVSAITLAPTTSILAGSQV